MVETKGLFDLQLMMFLLMGLGAFLRKREIITKEGRDCLTDLIMDVILPCNIISAFCISLDGEILKAGFQVLVISVLLQAACLVISGFCYKWVPKRQRMIMQYATLCANSGFLGNPVAEGLFGSLGLLFASIHLIPQRIVTWSAGLSYFAESPGKKEVVKKILTHPCIIATEIGMVLMVTQFRMPVFLSRTISSLGECTTAVTMVFIGTILAENGAKNLVSRLTVIFSVIRLVVIPVGVLLGCILFRVDGVAAGVSVVLAAMPAGGTTAILAAKYHGDEDFAAKCIVLTTVLSIGALPVWCWVLNRFF
ncbi:MAG: AEC family transporter [Hungatella sp.]|nr:AEC family transporter [Hungatella sp.]